MSDGAVRPRALRHRGVVSAHGFLLSADVLGQARRAASAIASYASGARVLQLDGASWLVCLPRPVRVDAERCHGAPLTRLEPGGHLAAAPLGTVERAGISDAHGPSVLWLEGGRLMQTPLARCAEIDLARLIELPELAVIELTALTDPPRPIERYEPLPPRAARAIFSDHVAPPSEEQQAMLRSLVGGESGRSFAARMARAASGVAGAMRTWAQRLRSAFGNASGAKPQRGAVPPRPEPAASTAPAVPSALSRLWSAMQRSLRLWTLRSPLGRALSLRQMRYMQKMLDLFEQRDLREALRHAIPLAQPGGTEPGQPALGVPEPRADLSLNTGLRSGGGSAFASSSLYAHLQQLYRQAAERLEREGKLHEAAFVYAELLGDTAAAIAMLERAGAYEQAAELAEGRKLAAGLVVRLWFLAKRVDRAIEHAVQHEAFADAIRRLSQHDVNAANALRLTWARRLASAGKYASAIDVLWPFEAARHVATAWLESVIALGGVPGARALARAIRLGRSAPSLLEDAHRGMLQESGYDAARCRMELATYLVEAGAEDNARVRFYLPSLLRAVLCDAAEGAVIVERRMRRAFETMSEDKVLIADIPTDLGGQRLERAPVTEIEWRQSDVGSLPIRDVARLANGGYALALGEGGIRTLTRDGRTRVQLPLPAEELIVSDNGMVATSIMRRDRLLCLGHVDFVSGRAERWADTWLDAYARDHDGEHWYVCRGDDVLCLDLLRTDLHARWHVTDRDFTAASIVRDGKHLTIASGATPHVWRYELPSLTLRRRSTREQSGEHEVLLGEAYDPAERCARVLVDAPSRVDGEPGPPPKAYFVTHGARLPLLESARCELQSISAAHDHAVAVYQTDNATIADVFTLAPRLIERVFRCTIRGGARVAVRLAEHRLLLADDRGRLLDYDLRERQVVHDLRVHL